MSLILDALKKLDREKSSRRKGTANIAAEILRPDPRLPRKRILLYFSAFSLTAVAAAAITYGLVGGSGFLWKPSSPSPVKPPAPSQQAASPPPKSDSLAKSSPPSPVNPPALGQQVPPASLSREPVRDAREEISRVPPKIQESAERNPPATSLGEKKAGRNVISKEAEVAPGGAKKFPEPTPKESATTPPLLKISGIVWHEEPSERRAVINGSFTKEGSVIEGVKVVEIFPTRVRFFYNGRTFEISVFQ
jgi:general secretion pathway protein B